MIEDTINLLNYEAVKRRILLIKKIDRNVPEFMIQDENRLKQILINIISNAIKFTFEGFVEVKAEYYYLKVDKIEKPNDKNIKDQLAVREAGSRDVIDEKIEERDEDGDEEEDSEEEKQESESDEGKEYQSKDKNLH